MNSSCLGVFVVLLTLVEELELAEFSGHEVTCTDAKEADGAFGGFGAAHQFASCGADGGGVRCRNRQ